MRFPLLNDVNFAIKSGLFVSGFREEMIYSLGSNLVIVELI
jgi:hypothetical protein